MLAPRLIIAAFLICLLSSGAPASAVVLYTSIDEPYARPIVEAFRKQTGIDVTLVTDTEAAKSAGLAERIVAERDRPRADVYWGNEVFHTIQLAHQRALAPYRSAASNDLAERWRGKDDLYTCVGLRVRMIALSTRDDAAALVGSVKRIEDLADPKLRGRIAMANPAFGTTSGHVAALYVKWGPEKFDAFFRSLRDNEIKLVGGNSAVAEAVVAGTIVAGPTDNDDIANAKADGGNITGAIPDQSDDGLGAMVIPSTVALVKGAPDEAQAKRLIDYIVSAEVERSLVERHFFDASVRDAGRGLRVMDVDYEQVAAKLKEAVERALTILQRREK